MLDVKWPLGLFLFRKILYTVCKNPGIKRPFYKQNVLSGLFYCNLILCHKEFWKSEDIHADIGLGLFQL